MATFDDRVIVEELIAGHGYYQDDPRVALIVEYENFEGRTTWGVTWVERAAGEAGPVPGGDGVCPEPACDLERGARTGAAPAERGGAWLSSQCGVSCPSWRRRS